MYADARWPRLRRWAANWIRHALILHSPLRDLPRWEDEARRRSPCYRVYTGMNFDASLEIPGEGLVLPCPSSGLPWTWAVWLPHREPCAVASPKRGCKALDAERRLQSLGLGQRGRLAARSMQSLGLEQCGRLVARRLHGLGLALHDRLAKGRQQGPGLGQRGCLAERRLQSFGLGQRGCLAARRMQSLGLGQRCCLAARRLHNCTPAVSWLFRVFRVLLLLSSLPFCAAMASRLPAGDEGRRLRREGGAAKDAGLARQASRLPRFLPSWKGYCLGDF